MRKCCIEDCISSCNSVPVHGETLCKRLCYGINYFKSNYGLLNNSYCLRCGLIQSITAVKLYVEVTYAAVIVVGEIS